MVLAGRPAWGEVRISCSIASTVSPWIGPVIAKLLKSQYPHLLGQNGTWM
jgi:hypothetical protein